jgi:hypothetical protein
VQITVAVAEKMDYCVTQNVMVVMIYAKIYKSISVIY